MKVLKTTVLNRRIELEAPAELPDGTEVLVEVIPCNDEKIGIEESEWRDDPPALTDWDAWIKTIEPLEFTAVEKAAMDCFDQEFRQFNLEAVRKQFAEGIDK